MRASSRSVRGGLIRFKIKSTYRRQAVCISATGIWRRLMLDWVLVVRIAVIALGLIFGAVSAVAANDVDPILWKKPSQRPEFRERLANDEYESRSKPYLKELGDLTKLAQSPHPDHGLRLNRIIPGGQADRWKLKPGDLLVKVDQSELWGSRVPHLQARRRIVVFPMNENKLRTVDATAGYLGIYMEPYWRPELTYWRSKKSRHAKWDDAVVVGCLARESDPELAETAWFRALQAGYPHDELTNICGAAIAISDGRCEQAADFAFLAREAEPKKAKFVSPVLLMRVMLANYKLSDAYELCQQYPEQLSDNAGVFQSLAELHNSRSESERRVEPPSRLAEQRYRLDLMPDCIPFSHSGVYLLPKLRDGNGFTLSANNEGAYEIEFSAAQPVRDVELVVKCIPLESHPGSSNYQFRVTLIPQPPQFFSRVETFAAARHFGLICMEGSRTRLFHGEPTEGTTIGGADASLDLHQSKEVRIVRLNGQAEVFLNGHRVLYQPVTQDDWSYAASARFMGIRAKVESLTFHELIEKK
jgi:hypothetical protein